MKSKGEIWVSAVLFISLGVIVISVILAAAIPMINRISDKNTIVKTKEVLITIDDAVNTVANEGPGSQRQLDSLVIDKGELDIINGTYLVSWSLDTSGEIMEKGVEITEGDIHEILNSTFVEEVNKVRLWVTSDKVNISLNSKFTSPFKGSYSVTIKNTGKFINDNPVVEISVV